MSYSIYERAKTYMESEMSATGTLTGNYYICDDGYTPNVGGADSRGRKPVDVAAATLAALTSGYRYGDACPVSGYSGFYCSNVSVKPDPNTLMLVDVTVKWEAPAEIEDWKFNGSSQQIHITAVPDPSKQRHYPAWESCGAAIGVNKDSVNGCDMHVWSEKLTITHHYTTLAAYVAAKAAADAVRNTLNGSAWGSSGWTAASGTVLFTGTNGEKRKACDWTLEYEFLIGKTAWPDTIHVGGSPIVFDGAGSNPAPILPWDYVSFGMEQTDGTPISGHPTVSPVGAIRSIHIATIYPYGFSPGALGLRNGPN